MSASEADGGRDLPMFRGPPELISIVRDAHTQTCVVPQRREDGWPRSLIQPVILLYAIEQVVTWFFFISTVPSES